MNKLGQREYIKLIAETLSEMDSSLKVYGTDVKMAQKVIKVLDEFLYFHHRDMNYNEFRKWCKERRSTHDYCNRI